MIVGIILFIGGLFQLGLLMMSSDPKQQLLYAVTGLFMMLVGFIGMIKIQIIKEVKELLSDNKKEP